MRPRTASAQPSQSSRHKESSEALSSPSSSVSSKRDSPSSPQNFSSSSSLLQPGSPVNAAILSAIEKKDRSKDRDISKKTFTQPMTSESSMKAVASKRTTRSRYMLILVLIAGSLVYFIMFMPSHEDWEPSGLRRFVGDGADTFTVTINSFNRHDMLMGALEHYSKCEYVKYIHVAWCE